MSHYSTPESDLIVFVHGFGGCKKTWEKAANEITEAAQAHGHAPQDHELWEYASERTNWWLRGIFKRHRKATLPTLGDALWSVLVSKYDESRHKKIILVGHSFGGLVIAACMTSRLLPPSSEAEESILNVLCSPVFVASPLAGSSLARLMSRLHLVFGRNIQLKHLTQKSPDRLRVETRLVDAVSRGQLAPHIFGAQNDRDVKVSELVPSELKRNDFGSYHIIDGTHTTCLHSALTNDTINLLTNTINSTANVNLMDWPTQSARPIRENLEPIQSPIALNASARLWIPGKERDTHEE